MNTSPTTQLSPNQRALLKIRDLKQQVEELKSAKSRSTFGGEIAIVSMACRFPRSAKTPEAFWQSLVDQTDEVGPIPDDRWDLSAFHDDDPDIPGKMYARQGVFLDEIDTMDPEFFGISPREATWVDPQQRLLMEVGYEALERAGWQADRIAETTGVFVGWMHNDYQNEASDSFLNLNPYIATGAAGSFLCGRLAYYLGLQGPSIAIDTACSSSLVAIHLACQSLQQGDCDQALVGGVNAICSPTTNILTCKLKALSPTGQSRAFDAAADGYLRGEGCGVVTLKRLEDAQRDGDSVLGVIRGSAVGHNGFSSGLTAPNPKAQEKVIRAALARAGVAPEDVDYLEAHGTGTELGDPIEMQAAAAALASGRKSENPLLVGSVKTNIGHLEAAAGMAGIIKVLLAMQNDSLPGQLNFETPNPHIAWDKIAVKVLTDKTPWPKEQQKIAGVSAFGMSGTNAHLVIEAPKSNVRSTAADGPAKAGITNEGEPNLIVLSGKSDESVRQLAGDYARHIANNPDQPIADVAFTSTCGRSHYEHRGAIVATNTQYAIERLRELERSATGDAVFSGHHRRTPKVLWQFTGQGSQYLSMGKGLYEAWPVFKEAIDQCDAWLMPLRERSLIEVMFGDDQTSIHQTQWTQPAIFAVQMGLTKLLQSWGLSPDAVLGHSVGQYAGACVAGVMSWQDGLNLISHRGRLIGELPSGEQGGQMLAVFASIDSVNKAVDSIDGLALAADNISHIVVSGSAAAIESAEAHFATKSARTKRLKTSHAFHSNLMEPALAPFEKIANEITFNKPQLPVICNVTGKVLAPDTILDGKYWAGHIRHSVQYSQSVEAAQDMGCEVILELGPHSVLTQMAGGKWKSPQSHLVACLQRDSDDATSICSAIGKMYACGVNVNFRSIHARENRKPVVLPTYPFERRRFWGPDKPRAAHAAHHTAHPLLGSKISLAGSKSEQRFETHIESDSPVWLPDHEVMGQAVMPGAAFIEMALQAVKADNGDGFRTIINAKFEQPLSPSARTALQTVIQSNDDGRKIETYSSAGESGTWSRHFTAALATSSDAVPEQPPSIDLEQLKSEFSNNVEADAFYAGMSQLGLTYGSAFQTIDTIATSDNGVLAQLSGKSDVRGYTIAPPLLDGCIHSLAVGILERNDENLFLPVGIKRIQFYQSVDDEIWCHARWTKPDGDVRTADLTLYDSAGKVVAELEELTVRQVNRAALRKMGGSGSARLLYEMQWQPYRLPAASANKRRWMLVCQNNGGTGEAAQDLLASVKEKLAAAGHEVVGVTLCESAQPTPSQIDNQSISISGSRTEWKSVFEHLSTEDSSYTPEGILWCVADDRENYLTNTDPTRAHVEGVLNLFSTLTDAGVRRLECGMQWATVNGMTTGPVDSDQGPVNVSQAKYAGLARVVGAEQPELRCRLIDLEILDSENDQTQPLFDFLTTETTESQFAVRKGEFYVPRLKPVKLKTISETFNASADGSYLITGGLGALGRQAGKWLADKGAGQVVLVSRRAPDEATQNFLDQISDSGCQAVVANADFGSPAEVKTLLARFGNDLLPLKGVIHAAGVLDDGLIGDQTWERFEKVLAPKIIGASLLHEATKSLELDFFILYSSVASVLGSRGQSNYALANAYLDGLAWQRRSMGLPGLAINWGPWAAGMADDPRILKQMALQGITPLANDEAHEVMEKMISAGLTQTTVMDVDWRRMQMGLGGESPSLLEGLAPSRKRTGLGDSEFVAKLKKLKGPARHELLKSTVSDLLQEILSTDGEPEADRPLIEMGLDSLMAVEFGTELQMLMGDAFTIAPTMLFDHHTIDAITDHVLELVEESDQGGGADSASDTAKSTATGGTNENARMRTAEDIAIVGLSCRFPGARNVDEFWENLLGGVDSVCDIPSDRWDIDKFYSADPQPGKMVSRSGGFIDDIGDFDAPFFNVSAEEACWIDPQHRMLLEHSYRAIEHAGICPRPLADNKVGVFMGIMGQDYAFLPKLEDSKIVEAFQGAGLSHSAGVGRISYHFGFEGPSVAVDTASSSSLVALYQAMRSLQEGACNMALAGGVNAILAPVNSLLMSKAGLLSPQGRCKSFSGEADGFGRGEGCGVVVLKRLSDARADGDRVLAVVKGGAVSHNGFSGGITAPSGKAQTRVITDALADARVAPNQVQYLEAHGTGTEYGDPMELSAAAAVYGKGRSNDDPLLVGSVKANISHLEAAGGVSGLIKTVMAIHTGTLPQQLHFEQPSPHVPWDRMPVKMVDQQQAWPECETRYAGVTALGLVGTNAHIVLASAPKSEQEDVAQPETDDEVTTNQLLVLSGKDTAGLNRVAAQYESFLEKDSTAGFADICFSAAVARRQFDHRIAVVAGNKTDAAAQLRKQMEMSAENENTVCKNPKVSFWFSGANSGASQALGQLSRQHPVVSDFAAQLDQRLSEFVLSEDWKKITSDSEFDRDAVDSDVALFALQASLVKLWEHWGVAPDCVAGTGVGQYLAACAAGGLCFLEAVTLVAAREAILKQTPAESLSDESVSPETTSMLDAFEAYADQLNFYPPNRKLICSVSGTEVPVYKSLGGSYWRDHCLHGCGKDNIDQTLAALSEIDSHFVLSVAPTSTDSGLNAGQLTSGATILRGDSNSQTAQDAILHCAAALYSSGVQVTLKNLFDGQKRTKVGLPVYPLEKKRYWITEISQHSPPKPKSRKLKTTQPS